MSNWVKVTAGTVGTGGGYVNLDQMNAIGIVPTNADPNKYALVVYNGVAGSYSSFESVYNGGPYDTVAEAETSLLGLLQKSNVVQL